MNHAGETGAAGPCSFSTSDWNISVVWSNHKAGVLLEYKCWSMEYTKGGSISGLWGSHKTGIWRTHETGVLLEIHRLNFYDQNF
jgi:hypothetical protein